MNFIVMSLIVSLRYGITIGISESQEIFTDDICGRCGFEDVFSQSTHCRECRRFHCRSSLHRVLDQYYGTEHLILSLKFIHIFGFF
jgi:hypothetical protein